MILQGYWSGHIGKFQTAMLRPVKAQLLALLVGCTVLLQPAVAAASSDAQTFLKDVHQTMVTDNWEEASALCELYLRKHKADPMGSAFKAYVLMQQYKDKEALPYFNAAIKGGVTALPSVIAEAHANNLWSLRGYSLLRSGKYLDGIKDLEKSLELKPETCLDILNQRIDCLNIGAAYKKMGNAQKSVSYINAGDLMKKQYHHVFYPILKTPSEAKYNADRLITEIKGDSKSTILLCKYAAHQVYLKQWGEAVKYLDKVIAIEPYLMPARLLRAQALKRLKRNAEAKKDIDAIMATRDKAGVNVWAIDQKELNGVLRL